MLSLVEHFVDTISTTLKLRFALRVKSSDCEKITSPWNEMVYTVSICTNARKTSTAFGASTRELITVISGGGYIPSSNLC